VLSIVPKQGGKMPIKKIQKYFAAKLNQKKPWLDFEAELMRRFDQELQHQARPWYVLYYTWLLAKHCPRTMSIALKIADRVLSIKQHVNAK
jgi:hypothetical protein